MGMGILLFICEGPGGYFESLLRNLIRRWYIGGYKKILLVFIRKQ